MAQWCGVSAVASQQEGPGVFCKAFVYSPYVCVGFFWVLQLPSQAKDMHVWLINDSRLAIYRMYFSLQQTDDM